jgi:tetratricopeptide (TPR) repeat protein
LIAGNGDQVTARFDGHGESVAATEWYRCASWSLAERDDFFARIARARRENRAQYLRIAGMTLRESGHPAAAVEVIDYLLREYPAPLELAVAHQARAGALGDLGDVEGALDGHRQAIAAERRHAAVNAGASLSFGMLVIRQRRADLYAEALEALDTSRVSDLVPVTRFQAGAIRAVTLAALRDEAAARPHARVALREAGLEHSGLEFHPTLGLVKDVDPRLMAELARIAGPDADDAEHRGADPGERGSRRALSRSRNG